MLKFLYSWRLNKLNNEIVDNHDALIQEEIPGPDIKESLTDTLELKSNPTVSTVENENELKKEEET